MSNFVHLHLHSEYSLLDGTCRISDIAKKAKSHNHTAVAITDHGVMYGAVKFYNECKKHNIKPIIGCEVYVAKRTRHDKNYSEDAESYHLILLCENETGYRNLTKLVSLAFTEGFYIKPRVDKQLLREYHEGLIALSACLGGEIPRLIAQDRLEDAKAAALEFVDIFGKDNFFLEIQDHKIPLQKQVNTALLSISKQLNIPLVATNDVHYLEKEDAQTQAISICIQTNNKITDGRPFGFETDEFYYKSTDQMTELFAAYPNAIENTGIIAQKCNFDFHFGEYLLPSFSPPNGELPKNYLKNLALHGLSQKISQKTIIFSKEFSNENYHNRMNYELEMIEKMGFCEYFLIVHDFVSYAKNQGIPVGPGRGSGAGSLVAYLLGITDVDPLKHDLLFERFLNPERISMPDFDIDFCYKRRDEVIKYVARRYGELKISQIITFGTMAARAAIRDCGRAMGMSYADVDRVAKVFSPRFNTIAEAEKYPPLSEMIESNADVKRLIMTAKSLEGMPRHASTHAAGIVICDRPVYEYVPLAVSGDVVVTQYDMGIIESLGLLKFDFLGLRYLTVIDDTTKLICQQIPTFKLQDIPYDDEKTYEMLKNAQTIGVFQLESPGMRNTLMTFRPKHLDDIALAISLFRPGPMDSIPKIVENRKKQTVTYKIPQLKEILDSTYGCLIYQEQVMQVFRKLASYSYGKADIVRRAISKKKPEIINEQKKAFLEGCKDNGIDEKEAQKLFDEIAEFAGYAFNKSHATAYAMIAYQTAYLKTHYPSHYFSALMTSEFGNREKLARYMSEAAKIKISTLPPTINESNAYFSSTNNCIRYGLLALKNIGIGFVDKLVKERTDGGFFTSFFNFVERMYGNDLNKQNLESLIMAGTLDNLGLNRSVMIAIHEDVLRRVADSQRSAVTRQVSLFEDDELIDWNNYELPNMPEYSIKQKLAFEKEVSGMYFSGHITDEYSKTASDLNTVSIHRIINSFSEDEPSFEFEERQIVTILGVVNSKTIKKTKSGDSMAFVRIEDRYGEIEIIIFTALFKQWQFKLNVNDIIAINGEISLKDDEGPKIIARSIATVTADDKYIPTSAPSPFAKNNTRVSKKPQNNEVIAKVTNKNPTNYKWKNDSELTANSETPIPCEKIYLRVAKIDDETTAQVIELINVYKGETPIIFYEKNKQKYTKLKDTGVKFNEKTKTLLCDLLGKENVVVK